MGTPGAAGSLVRVDPEPAGANCPAGGAAIHVGVDADGDGALSNAEIASTTYVCSGAGGGTPEDLTGDVVGIALREGATQHGGIDVQLRRVATSSASEILATTVTSSSGAYTFRGLPVGVYRLTVSTAGRFTERMDDVVVLPGVFEVPRIDLLASQQLLASDDVVVHAARSAGDVLLVHSTRRCSRRTARCWSS